MKKLAIIGASYLQAPLILKAKEMGLETHVFAWQCGDVGEELADFFYPISIVEVEEITNKCKEIGIDGICTIASDLAVITVNKVATAMGLPSNSLECTGLSTNKHNMRDAFFANGDPSPKSILVESVEDLKGYELDFPLIVKPTDRSGSRGITKVFTWDELPKAIEDAKSQGFEKNALVEEFATGNEYSVEFVSYKGEHHFLAITKKYTTGAPNFIETGHIEPSDLDEEMTEKVKAVVLHALQSLKVTTGASHSELKIDKNGNIKIIEIGGRMGGDYIGSHLVHISTGVDFVKCVIDCALGNEPNITPEVQPMAVGVRFVFNQEDIDMFKKLEQEHPEYIVLKDVPEAADGKVVDSSSRFGVYLFKAENKNDILKYMPEEAEE